MLTFHFSFQPCRLAFQGAGLHPSCCCFAQHCLQTPGTSPLAAQPSPILCLLPSSSLCCCWPGRAGPLFPPSDGPSAHRFLASHRAEHRRCLSSWGPWLQMTVTWGALNNRYLFSHCSGRCTSKPGCQQSRAPSEDSRGEPLLAPYHSGGTGLSWACGPITEVSASSSQGHPDPQAPSAFLSSGHLSVDLSPTG